MNTLAQSIPVTKVNQLDLFSFSHGLYTGKAHIKMKKCLDCDDVDLPQTYDTTKGIYLGNRLCTNCKGSQKSRFFTF